MAWRQFYWRWGKQIFTRPLAWSGLAVGIVRLLVLPVRWYLPAWEPVVNNLVVEAAFWAFVAACAVRLFLAPYWLDQEREQTENALQGTLVSKEKEIALLTEVKIICEVHGNPQPLIFGQQRYLLIPEVTLTNHSYGASATVDAVLEMLRPPGLGTIVCLPDNQGAVQWAQSPAGSGLSPLICPSSLTPRCVKKGYLAFRPPASLGQIKNISTTLLRSSTNGARRHIQFKEALSQKVIHEEEIEFHGI